MSVLTSRKNVLTLALALGIPSYSGAAQVDDATLRALLDRLERLEQQLGTQPPAAPAEESIVAELQQRLAILERKIEIQAEEAVAKAPTTPAVSINEKGLAVLGDITTSVCNKRLIKKQKLKYGTKEQQRYVCWN